ncbi:NifB/NifX family molybdenum-iron cluster-binding protein [Vibrio panuliri]|uniref:Dinitrogenase iron-molybdenum cofactor biosynthesis domain-containing protein n=1 Tax=Vibrio panuliri TaxID=1381081 RepID=A0ABX3FNU0_9VIBR|nr:NifB/NifX family molybdenum-iron cluster-binding protein [Vibrio panuliri]KAB1457918.1 hypothetical protein F7O85_09355 [Vibrio panuliri]OLQ95620.1 hypothetical protein BIY20_06145 [Vibrio panuliri]
MIYAIPTRDFQVANHFSRSPNVVIFDDEHHTHQLIQLVETPSQCGKKKQWVEILNAYQVDAVVVRSIGKKMLKRLFDMQMKVLVSPAKAQVQHLDFNTLEEVKSIEYGREPRKQSSCCGSKKSAKPSMLLNPASTSFGAIKRISK